jgi:hypothetical protein
MLTIFCVKSRLKAENKYEHLVADRHADNKRENYSIKKILAETIIAIYVFQTSLDLLVSLEAVLFSC